MDKYVKRIEPLERITKCKYCRSRKISTKEIRKNKSGDVQRMRCKDCKRTFSANIGFRYRRYTKETITMCVNLYHSGLTIYQVSAHMETLGYDISPSAIHRWVDRYSKVADTYMNSLKPDVGDRYRADEGWMRVRGERMYLFASMDDDTRYWLAMDLAATKFSHDASTLFRATVEHTGKLPSEMITDGLPSYGEAADKVFGGVVTHTSEVHLRGRYIGMDNNNKMERLNGTIRDREKIFRGLKTTSTGILPGMRVHYNHVRKHIANGGVTPGEKAGIIIEGRNKWLAMIQNGSLYLQNTDQRV